MTRAIVPHHTLRVLYELERQAKARGDLIAVALLDLRIRRALRGAA